MRSHVCRADELPLRRRYPFLVLAPVFEPEQAHVDAGFPRFFQIDLIRTAILRRQVLEQEDLEEPPQRRIAEQEVVQPGELCGELGLDAAD